MAQAAGNGRGGFFVSLPTIRAAAEYFDVPFAEMFGLRRHRTLAYARFAVFYIMRERDQLSYPQIGRRLHKDHSSVIHGHRMARDLIKRHDEFAAFISAQMDLPKHSAAAAFLPSPYVTAEPLPQFVAPPAPRLKSVPLVTPEPKQWERAQASNCHDFMLDDDGLTVNDHLDRRNLVMGSRALAAAINLARAA